MKKLSIVVMHLVKHIELVRKYLTFDVRKLDKYDEKEILTNKVNSNFDRNFESTPPVVY